MRFTLYTLIAVVVASLFEIIPTFLIRSNVPTIASVQALHAAGAGRARHLHRRGLLQLPLADDPPDLAETKRYGEYSKPGEFVYDHPFQWGSRRIGPDLAREGGKQANWWHLLHFNNPRDVNPRSIMPVYPNLLKGKINFEDIQGRVHAMAMLGVPYGDAVNNAPEMAREQARLVAEETLLQAGGYAQMPEDLWKKLNGGVPASKEEAIEALAGRKVTAVIAYLQRMGTDITKTEAE